MTINKDSAVALQNKIFDAACSLRDAVFVWQECASDFFADPNSPPTEKESDALTDAEIELAGAAREYLHWFDAEVAVLELRIEPTPQPSRPPTCHDRVPEPEDSAQCPSPSTLAE